MKKILLTILLLPFLSNCTQYSAMVGPTLTLAESGSFIQATTSLSRSLAMTNVKQSLTDEIKSENIREKILKNSPEKNDDFFVVPKVVE